MRYLFLFLLLISHNCYASEKPITIGVILPLSGAAAPLGNWVLQGINEAKAKIPQEIKLEIEDDRCDGKTALSAYHKLREGKGINLFIGPLCLNARVPIVSIKEQDPAVLMITGLAVSNLQKTRKNAFHVLPSVAALAEKLVTYIADQTIFKKLSLISIEDEYGEENIKALNNISEIKGLEIINTELFQKGVTDFRTQIAKLKSDNSSAIIVVGYSPDYKAFLTQAYELAFNKPIFAVSNFQTQDVLGTKLPVIYSYPETKAEDPATSMYIGAGYDSLMILSMAFDSCKTQSINCIANFIQNKAEFEGSNGLIKFNNIGFNIEESHLAIKRFNNGLFIGD